MIQKPDIKKHINNQPKVSVSSGGKKIKPLVSPEMIQVAQAIMERPALRKVGVATLVYLVLAGIVGTIVGIVKLVNIAF